MKSQLKLALFAFGAFVVAEGAQSVRAQDPVNPSQNPSQTTPSQNPSQTTPRPAPGQSGTSATPPGPTGTNGTLQSPIGEVPLTVPPAIAPNTPNALPRVSDWQLRNQVRTAITQGVIPSNENTAPGSAISVTNLRVTQTGGKVTLSGFVSSEKDKADAGARAAAILGEQNVVNQLIVR